MNNDIRKKRALITGINGQDGSYLADFLLSKGYEVFGLVRRVSLEDEAHRLVRIKHIHEKLHLLVGSLESFPSIYNAIRTSCPDEVYHLAAQSFVNQNFDDEFSTFDTNITGTHYLLSACRDLAPKCKLFFAGTSEMFGRPKEFPQNEKTPFWPTNAYGISKVAGFHLVKNYRDSYKMYACSGIPFNHESPRRGYEFVTRKITSHVAKIKLGLASKLELGNLDAKRDWGHAIEYIRGFWLMLQQDKPRDYVFSTGKLHSVREFCDEAFSYAGLNYTDWVVTNPKFYRHEEQVLVGDSTLAHSKLKWKPLLTFREIVHQMVENDLKLLESKL